LLVTLLGDLKVCDPLIVLVKADFFNLSDGLAQSVSQSNQIVPKWIAL